MANLSLLEGLKFGVSALLPGGVPLSDAYDNLFGENRLQGDELNDWLLSYGYGDGLNDASDAVSDIASVATPNSSDGISDSLSDFYDKVNEAVDNQNSSAQATADEAMEFEEEQSKLQFEREKELMKYAMELNNESADNYYSRLMQGLQRAGINPKLAGSLGSMSLPTVSAGSASAGSGHVANMSMANISAVASAYNSYLTNVTSLDKSENDFAQNLLLLIASEAIDENVAKMLVGKYMY